MLSMYELFTVKSCGMPKAPVGGFAVGTSYTYGSVVKYSCGVLYNLVGSNTTVCQANATWSGDLPRCKPSTSLKLHHYFNSNLYV